ncbi:hypothetical protein QL285_047418 [Trifolium repens]|nr:hypothetical protein QL285_047418 [Trifolium repens]
MKGYVIWAFAHPAQQLPYPISLWIRDKESDSFSPLPLSRSTLSVNEQKKRIFCQKYCKRYSLSLHFLQVKRFLFTHMLQSAETRNKEQDPSHSISPFSTAQFQFF